MDDAMLIPVEERGQAFAALTPGPTEYSPIRSFLGLPATPVPTRDERLRAVEILKRSQAYVSLFDNRQRVAIFWSTEEIARRYTQVRNSLIAFSMRAGETIGQEAVEVSFNWQYSHSSPYRPGGQETLIDRYSRKMHAIWLNVNNFETAVGDSVKSSLGLDIADRLDLQWCAVRMLNSAIDRAFAYVENNGGLLNPEPFELPAVVHLFPPGPNPTQADREVHRQRYIQYQRQLREFQNCIHPRAYNYLGMLDTILTADGLAFTRAGYPKVRTPILTWKQIRSVLPKRKKKVQTTVAHNPDAKRKLVIVQRKEEE